MCQTPDLLADEKQMRDIAMRGVEKTAEKHTWAQRAIELEEKIRVQRFRFK